ncbi:MAG: Mur ligase family protein [Firmicutes bacterium]|nr:Mur ligase family protein [Bacillota bacterium]
MTYEEYLASFLTITREPTLDVTKFFMQRLNNPHQKFKSVHVAGTNGKGSVVETLYSILQVGGYKVGKFISPYLIEFNEYISINGTNITDEEINEYIEILKPLVNEYQDKYGKDAVKHWDILTSMAYMHFSKHRVDIAIIEVGMGGTWDSTNVITPLVSVITKIHFDHKEVLGNTIREIAANKAGIIKHTVPVVTGNHKTALTVIEERARAMNSPIIRVLSKDATAKNFRHNQPMTIRYKGKEYHIKLKGRHQAVNTALALEALFILENMGFPIGKEKIDAGLLNVSHPARFEVISDKPIVIFDGAHNADSLRGFMELIRDYYKLKPKNKLFIIAMLERKDPDEAMAELAKRLPRNSTIVFTCGVNVTHEKDSGTQNDSSREFHSAQTLQQSYLKFDKKHKQTGNGTSERRGHSTTKCMDFCDILGLVTKNHFPETCIFIIGSFKTYKTTKEVLCR